MIKVSSAFARAGQMSILKLAKTSSLKLWHIKKKILEGSMNP